MASLLSDIETLVRFRLIEPGKLLTPTSIRVTPIGGTGTTVWSYVIVATNAAGTTAGSAPVSVPNGLATLSTVGYNQLAWQPVPGATGYLVYRLAVGTSPSTTGLVATLGATSTFNDVGQAGDGTSPPTTNTAIPSTLFWTSDELIGLINAGIKDLWRDTADLKQEHFLVIDNQNPVLMSQATQLSGVPADIHKIYMIEPRDLTVNGNNHGLLFKPLPYNHRTFQMARSLDAIEPQNGTIYYAIHSQGSPVGAPTIMVAPKVTAAVPLAISYVPTVPSLTANMMVPIPGEADNALVAWTVAYARAKERDDHEPDPGWLTIYGTEKAHLLQSLGLRQYQEPTYVSAMFEEYWG